ncbi:hypothetical protein SAMN04487785_108193 [Dyella jiangningensis]|uniref:hypothetical protein n=1 Tax=Dyella sp. AtDHG13 TaxID=1938897 RepID=UPI00088A78F2|nr:hypothetical protein [Dyella sp. AtDHG13]PXV55808.1 hypothetical protein BDW41_1105 [Dyella sp. AtDHG13]SDK55968.1 hypothetical protein SAMN04487785_108193 [Dyella jiangningensis]
MNDIVIAEFDTQFAACAALDKLISRGLPRQGAHIRSTESIGGSAASSSAPTSVVSRVSHRSADTHEVRAPASPPDPAVFGHATLTVRLSDQLSLEDMLQLMQRTGARQVQVLEDQDMDAEDAALSPDVDYGKPEDLDRAIKASRS